MDQEIHYLSSSRPFSVEFIVIVDFVPIGEVRFFPLLLLIQLLHLLLVYFLLLHVSLDLVLEGFGDLEVEAESIDLRGFIGLLVFDDLADVGAAHDCSWLLWFALFCGEEVRGGVALVLVRTF
jgi:hypothetical protein